MRVDVVVNAEHFLGHVLLDELHHRKLGLVPGRHLITRGAERLDDRIRRHRICLLFHLWYRE